MARGRADRDLVGLTVLALLSVRPAHPYELHRFVIDTHKDYIGGLPRSLYHAVDKLERDGLIEAMGTERQAGRPERTVYALTEAGRREVRRRVETLLATPTPDADLSYAALSFVAVLEKEQAIAAVRERCAALEATIAQLEAALAAASEVEPLLLVESEFELARVRAERAWMVELVDRVESGRLTWLDAFAGATAH